MRSPFPAGVTEGQLIRLAGQGEAAPGGGRAGDLYLEVHIRPHRLYQLEGRDVTLTLPIAPWEAALGRPVTVPTLAARWICTSRPARSPARSCGCEAAACRVNRRGIEYVQLKVVLPPANSPEATALYEEMRASSGVRSARRPREVSP